MHCCQTLNINISLSQYCPCMQYVTSRNDAIEWLALLLHIWEELASILGPGTGCPEDEVFSDFSQSL